MTMPVSFHIRPQDQKEVPGQEAKDHHADDIPSLEPEIPRSPAPQMSPSSPPRHTTSAAAADTPGPSYSAHHSPEYIHASSREIAGVMDAICSLAATQAAQGSEVGPVPFHADTDHDPPGSSSCSWSTRGAHH